MPAPSSRRRLWAAGLAALALSAAMAGEADAARRGGSFGSRGSRTYSQPGGSFGGGPFAAPITRSVTPNRSGGFQPGGYQQGGYQQGGFNRPFGGPQTQGGRRSWAGPLLGGLAAGGFLGMMMGGGFGGGFGGGAGAFGGLLQMLLLAGAAFLLFRMFQSFRRRREEQAPVGGVSRFDAPRVEPRNSPSSGFGNGGVVGGFGQEQGQAFGQGGGFGGQSSGGQGGDELGLGRSEIQALERTFAEVQAAYGREDYASIRERCTPEVMSFMSEELARNATEGRKNEMRDFRVLHSDLTESWREDTGDYATLALRFTSLDWWVERRTGAVVEGDPNAVVEATEFWTFNRQPGAFGAGGWKVSAVQEQAR